ncbi:restriction endonuclease subunit S [Aliarcobacter cryaerophilus]|uniref:restriction endonuclease subunit S n=1 Tax=Aliarcobacter cryaerophilus TaxID=28198 RepID=UPI0021B1CBCF|nr:restriction endonuclease subunit S [Aliarcobacter cryaerophilus]MCT7433412.1 restriction endonuclease subunit S [Aliarcobacter cryaerophilus]
MAELYSLPDGWEWKKLGKIAKLQNGFAFKSKLFVNDGLPIVRIKNIKNEKVLLDDVVYFNVEDYGKKLDSYQIKKNDILIAMSGATTGKIGLYDTEEISYLNQRVGLFRIENSNLRSYLFYFLSTQIEKNLELSLGAAQPNLSTEQINNIELPLPPLEEQKRIVAKLDILFAKIDKAIALHQKNIDEADIFMASVLNDVFVELEEKYPFKKVSDGLKNILTGTTPPTKEEKYYNEPSINWYSPSDFGKSKVLSLSKNMINSIALTDKKAKIYEKNTLLLVAIGATVGKIGVIKEEASSNQQITAMKFKDDIDVDFSYYWFYYIKQIIINTASAATLPIINQSAIKDLKFIIPPLQTQQKVVSYLDEISNKMEKIKNLQKKKMQSLKELKASILDKAFKGEL